MALLINRIPTEWSLANQRAASRYQFGNPSDLFIHLYYITCSASYSADLNGHAIRDACEKLNKKLDVIKGTVHKQK